MSQDWRSHGATTWSTSDGRTKDGAVAALSHLATRADKPSMQTTRSIYRGFCFPPEVIAHAGFLYHRFPLSLRDVEDLLAQRGIAVSYETIRRWCRRFGPHYARNVRRQRPTAGDHWLLDEVFLQIQGRRQYLWRAIDQDGDILDILMQRRRNGRAATRFVRKLLKQQQRSPNRVVTDKLGSYRVWCNKAAEASLVTGRSAAHGPCREPPRRRCQAAGVPTRSRIGR